MCIRDSVITATRREREEKGKNSSASVIFSVSLLTELANLLSAKAGFDKKEIGKITKLAQPLNKALTSYYKSNSGLFLRKGGTAYDDEIALLEAACAPRKAPTGYSAAGGHKKLLADLKECKSPARLEDILDNVRAMKNEIDKDAALKEVFLNEHVTTDILETIDYAFFTTKARDELLSALSKTDRWHLWVARNHWDLSDEEIGMSSDPKATIMALLELPELNTEYALGSLAKSAYLTDDLVPKVTPLLFTAPEVPAKVSNVLDGLLNSKLLSTNDWQTFESMAEDYQGSIGDLLGVISAN